MKSKKLNILITGGTGFVGKNLIENMKKEKKYSITLLIRKRVDIKDKDEIEGDLMYYDSIKNAFKDKDIVIHLANSKNYSENVTITGNIVRACKEMKIKKIIFTSSMSAKRAIPDLYGKSKILSEEIIRESGLNYTLLRPSIIYGKGSTSFNFILDKTEKIPFFTPIIGNGKYILMPVHISDVVFSIVSCIENKKTDRKEYDIVGKDKIYFIDLVNILKKEVNDRKKNFLVPIWLCKFISIIFPKIITKENIINFTQGSIADTSQAREDFNYNPKEFMEGVKNGLI